MADYISQYSGPQIDEAVGRALPGGTLEALIAEKAPNGYGLGTASKFLDSWNNANANGFFYSRTDAPNGYWWIGTCEITANDTTRHLKIECPVNNFGYTLECHRSFKNGEWGPYEWVNPPMELGKEYLTTERYLGKPVYVQAVSTGALPVAGGLTSRLVVSMTTPNIETLVRENVEITDGQYPSKLPRLGNNLVIDAGGYPRISGSNLVYYLETSKDMSTFTGVFTAWYTKTTD